MLVTRARIQAGENVLIWGGVGGLGVMAIQICRLFGANPIPVVGGAEKVAKAQEIGATDVIDRKSEDVAERVREITKKAGVDIVFEHSGQDTWPTSIAALRWGGRLVVCGASTGFEAVTDLRFLWNKQQNLLGSHLSNKAELSAALARAAGHPRALHGFGTALLYEGEFERAAVLEEAVEAFPAQVEQMIAQGLGVRMGLAIHRKQDVPARGFGFDARGLIDWIVSIPAENNGGRALEILPAARIAPRASSVIGNSPATALAALTRSWPGKRILTVGSPVRGIPCAPGSRAC
jgi:hypothetical protein